ncbi:substrate-binding domain-containing protein [Niabella hibiscisoli]|uniref:substrate-binding domain-containing protein n=1 Tax=Niabella hibiscisoli TaxID=1825928 RepID=UPI001F0E528C|nr:substrate-binding domain-containing protein [Niabella hibiscisoli]MCH5715299.1 substrate-binding domain-containing protein [Niabella hibiscisoli]
MIADRYFPKLEAHCVNVDNLKAAYDAVSLFIEHDKKAVGLINYKTDLAHLNDRTKGYMNALKSAGVTPNKNWVKKVDIANDPQEIEKAVASLLTTASVNAIFFASNRIAVHALKYIQDQQIAVPQDIELIGFDENEVFDFIKPQLSFVKQPMLQLGQIATELLVDIITQNKKEHLIFIPAELVKRGSTNN